MRQEKRCTNCGKQDERTLNGRRMCSKCAEKDNARNRARLAENPEIRTQKRDNLNAWRHDLMEKHLCVDCKRQDAYTLNGRARCFECSEKNREGQRKRRNENLEAERKKSRDQRQQWREAGKCTRCGRDKPAWEVYAVCERCRARDNDSRQRKREQRDDYFPRGTTGLCYFCLQPVMDGKKECRRCYDARMPGLKKAQEAARATRSRHIWRMYDKEIFKRRGKQ